MVEYVFKGVVVNAPTGSVNIATTSVNIDHARGLTRFARRSLDGATAFSVKLDGNTRIWGRHDMRGSDVTFGVGDRLVILIRAPRGMAAADLPPARFVFDRGPGKGVVTPPAPAPVIPPAVELPPVAPPGPPPELT